MTPMVVPIPDRRFQPLRIMLRFADLPRLLIVQPERGPRRHSGMEEVVSANTGRVLVKVLVDHWKL